MGDNQERDGVVVWDKCPPIPEGTKPLEHQVAGHVFGRRNGHKKNQLGFLQDTSGCILKPVQGGSKGLREVRFYDFIEKEPKDNISYKKIIQNYLNDECIASGIENEGRIITEGTCKQMRRLKDFVPKFHGLWDTPVHPGVSYMKLQNLTEDLQHPCVMDVKVGYVTTDRFADDAKKQRELSKCPALKQLGFQLLGIKVFNIESENYHVLDRYFLRALKPDNIIEQGFKAFFRYDGKPQKSLLLAFVSRLQSILHWFEGQRSLTFLASSLLFVYDAAFFINLLNADLKLNGRKEEDKEICSYSSLVEEIVKVKMIDFTHVFPSEGEIDENYINGLRSLISYLENVK